MQAYWPFHKTQCRRNEFADMVEEQEPKFARWMRQHGKLAVLKDDEVDRLERAGAAASGAGRQVGARGRIQKSDCCQAARLEAEVFVLLGLGWQHSAPHAPATEQSVSQSIIPAASPYLPVPSMQEVMESMYGRAEPKPEAPAYTAEEKAAMRRAAEADKASARLALQRGGGPAYAAVELPPQLSLDCQRYKWRQSQSHVEVFVPLPEGLPAGRVAVRLTTSAISVCVDEAPVLAGRLYREIKAEESTWFIQDGVLEISMLKRCRRGAYEAGKTNAGV
jgi:hypothetical protein